ncbi:hypothetical protein [Variovorax sp.]|uniref:hypothetical protein n=1 Tax=Variovorax sp. TaxID=1871043 RepID=UPI003BADBB94
MFSLPEFTKVKVLDVTVLSQKNRPAGANPGVRLNVQADLPNYVLAAFDGALRTALFTKSEAAAKTAKERRQTLPGVEEISDLPHLTSIARHVRKVAWNQKLTGYTVTIDHGTGGKSNLVLADSALENWRFQAKEGGTVAAWWSVEVVDVPKAVFAELAALKSREVPMTYREPEVAQQDIEDEEEDGDGSDEADPPAAAPAPKGKRGKSAKGKDGTWPFPNDAPGEQSAEDAFAATAGQQEG